jgi:hypothetical protein
MTRMQRFGLGTQNLRHRSQHQRDIRFRHRFHRARHDVWRRSSDRALRPQDPPQRLHDAPRVGDRLRFDHLDRQLVLQLVQQQGRRIGRSQIAQRRRQHRVKGPHLAPTPISRKNDSYFSVRNSPINSMICAP